MEGEADRQVIVKNRSPLEKSAHSGKAAKVKFQS
jgi:hypothetical protein